jgi:hypothetical protein
MKNDRRTVICDYAAAHHRFYILYMYFRMGDFIVQRFIYKFPAYFTLYLCLEFHCKFHNRKHKQPRDKSRQKGHHTQSIMSQSKVRNDKGTG